MKMSKAFPSKWLKADDVGVGRKVRCIIREVAIESIGSGPGGGEDKPVLYFEGKQKGMVLNRTEAGKLMAAYGDESDEWKGKEVFVFVEMKMFQGRMVPGLSVETPRQVVETISEFESEAAEEEPPF